MLGSCVETIQHHISTVETSKEAWDLHSTLFANKSRTRVMSLKERLFDNPKGTRTILEYMQDMRAIADDLALANSLVNEDDLVIQVLKNLDDDNNEISDAIRARDSSISFAELHDKLVDFEMQVKKRAKDVNQMIQIANYTNRQHSNSNQGGRPSPRSNWQQNTRISENQRRYNNPNPRPQW